jgi:plastocyanin
MLLGMVKIAALLCAAVVIAGCGSDNNSNSSTSSASGGGGYGSKPATTTSAKTPGEIEVDDNYFKPTTVTGKPGEKVTLELKNEGKAEHTFTIDSQKVDKELHGGDKAEVSLTIPKSGTDTFYCRYHMGMTGKLSAAD